MTDQKQVSLAAERAADRLRCWFSRVPPVTLEGVREFRADLDALDAARLLLHEYEVAEQDIREQVAGTTHEQPPAVEGPRFLRAVFESQRVAIVGLQQEIAALRASPAPAQREP